MEKQIRLVDKSKCTGCRACSNVCPTSSIHFELDGLHYYPKINEDSCIKCGKCISVCSPLQWEKNHPAESEASAKYAENGGYPPTQNGDIRSLFWLFSLMALQN